MAVQFNLLPDVKLEYIRARRMKRTVVTVSIVSAVLALAIFVGLFVVVNVFQKQHIENLTDDINEGAAKIQAVQDIDKVLTVQNQLNQLTALHEAKPDTSRALDYLAEVTPAKAQISDTVFDFDQSTITITGNADNLKTVNKFADTLKFTKYSYDQAQGESVEQQNAFSNVVLSSFGVAEDGVNYEMTLSFNPEIFNNTKKVSLKVPNIVSTRSSTEKPSSDLFETNGGDQ